MGAASLNLAHPDASSQLARRIINLAE